MNARKALVIMMIVMFAAVAAHAKSMEVTKKAGENTVTVTLEKDPPVTGDNAVTVTVKDASGKAVTDAKVVIDYGMPAMHGMPAMW